MPSAQPGRINYFIALLWGLSVLIALYLFAWPPLEGVWAKSAWKQVPCYAPDTASQYFFEFDGKTYASTRRTLWIVINASPFSATPGAALMARDICYVRPDARGGPGIAVLKPLTLPTQEQMMSRLAILVMVVATVLIMTWRVGKTPSAHPKERATEALP